MASTKPPRDAADRVTGELHRCLTTGDDTVTLADLADATGLTPRDVEHCMAVYEGRVESPIERRGTPDGGIEWQLRNDTDTTE